MKELISYFLVLKMYHIITVYVFCFLDLLLPYQLPNIAQFS